MTSIEKVENMLLTQPLKPGPVSPEVLSGAAFSTDFLAVFVAGLVGYAVSDTWTLDRLWICATLSLCLAAFASIALLSAGAYKLAVIEAPFRRSGQIILPFIGVYAVAVIIALKLVNPIYFNEKWLTMTAAFAVFGLVTSRMIIFFVFHAGARSGRLARRIAIVGAGSQGAKLADYLNRNKNNINVLVGVFDDRVPNIDRVNPDLHVDGSISDLVDIARAQLVDDVIVALPWTAEDRIAFILRELSVLPIYVHIGADLAAFRFPGRIDDKIAEGLPMLTVAQNPFSGWRRLLKSAEDYVIASILVALFSPIMLATAIAIKLDSPGPIIYRQKRYGFNNQRFDVLKFRSMTHAPSRTGPTQQAQKADPRITRVGKVIRRTSLDELPQLLNVLNGTMSLVGPRPHAIDHNEQYGRVIDGYFSRHKVKPGITGLAQVNGLRGETDTVEKMDYRVRYDRYYIENWSVLMDLEILALSAFIGFVGKNAY